MHRPEPMENVTAHMILSDGSKRKFHIPHLANVAQGFRYIRDYLAHNKLPRAASIRFIPDEPSPPQVEEDLNKHDQTLDQTLRDCAELLGRGGEVKVHVKKGDDT